MRTVSLAIPTYNRFDFLTECISYVIDDPRIGEIVVSDDASTDGSYEKLQTLFKSHPKVKLFRNGSNVDCYRNKALAVERATLPWVILFDDDNVLPKDYLDTLYGKIWEVTWQEDTVYCPDYAEPYFDYTAFGGSLVNRSNVAEFMKKPHFSTALNTANYFFHREHWLRVWDSLVEPNTADSIYQAYRLLSGGCQLMFVRGLRYFHRVHEKSHYKLNVHRTGNFASKVEEMLRQLR